MFWQRANGADTEDLPPAGQPDSMSNPAAMKTTRRRPALGAYVAFRLGEGPGAQLRNLLVRPLGARSFAEFWRYWNPVYGYVLLYYVYRPLRRLLPRRLAAWLSFVACGFVLHDLPLWLIAGRLGFPGMTVFFSLVGAGAVLSESLRINLARYPFIVRAGCNLAPILGAWAIIDAVRP